MSDDNKEHRNCYRYRDRILPGWNPFAALNWDENGQLWRKVRLPDGVKAFLKVASKEATTGISNSGPLTFWIGEDGYGYVDRVMPIGV